MELRAYLPFWDQMTRAQQQELEQAADRQSFRKGMVVHAGSGHCTGLLVVCAGQLRVFTLSEEGKELTLYRLLERDICLFSAACMLRGAQFDLSVQAEQDTVVFHIPPEVYRRLMESCTAVANYTNELMATRFSDVMWLMDQLLHKKMDSRLAALLLEEEALSGSAVLTLTHEQLASHLGSAREVVTRLLRHLTQEGLVRLGRGTVEILDEAGLEQLAGDSLR